jgi:hypothetical protein
MYSKINTKISRKSKVMPNAYTTQVALQLNISLFKKATGQEQSWHQKWCTNHPLIKTLQGARWIFDGPLGQNYLS